MGEINIDSLELTMEEVIVFVRELKAILKEEKKKKYASQDLYRQIVLERLIFKLKSIWNIMENTNDENN